MSHARQARTGALTVLTSCFVVSALLRGPAVLAALPAFAEPSTPVAGADAGIEPAIIEGTALSRELQRQRAELDAREEAVAAREAELRALELEMTTRLEELRTARDDLEAKATIVRDAARNDLRQLSSVYARMRPKEAGRLFETMAPAFAAGFLGDMQPETAAAILANMSTESAYAVSLMLAGRHLSPDAAEAASPGRAVQ